VGRVRLGQLADALANGATLVTMMAANNETGTLQPITEISRLAHEHGALVHCDAAQMVGKLPFDVRRLDLDLVSLSGHKLYGPKGVGALYIRRRRPPLRLDPVLDGGGQEHGLRSGTVNLPGIVGLAHALEIADADRDAEAERQTSLRDRIEKRLCDELEGILVNGDPGNRLPGTTNLAFDGVEGKALLAAVPDLAISTGSACASDHGEPSHVMLAMGLSRSLASSSLRISVGRPTTGPEIDHAAERIVTEVHRLRAMHRRRR
jgi:cysteine desulfurase